MPESADMQTQIKIGCKGIMKQKKLTKIALLIFVLALASSCSKLPGNPQAASPETSAQPEALASNNAGPSSQLPFGGDKKKGTGQSPLTTEPLIIPAGTPVTVRLQTAVSSNMSNPGDRFDAVLDGPLVVGTKTIAPSGAAVTGRVISAHRSGRLQDPGVIQLALASITVEGKSYPVTSSSVIAKGASHKKRNWAMIGGGAGGGALIGGLLGGPKGMVIGSAVGAGAGTSTAYATGKKDVGFGTERRLTFRLKQPVVLH